MVSFPGKYSHEWDAAVSAASKQQDDMSLACVFLTDRASGLGLHADNPDTPGKCWCHAIYGRMAAKDYVSKVDLSKATREELEFKTADAEAMGLCLVVKTQADTELKWRAKVQMATQDAEWRCAANNARAPWGCQWFEEWRKNVHRAVELEQTLHVFYFEGMKGQGKMHWNQLCNEGAKEESRKCSGLGASQTAEVAYLDKMGFSYIEHDITEFEPMLQSAFGRFQAAVRRSIHRLASLLTQPNLFEE